MQSFLKKTFSKQRDKKERRKIKMRDERCKKKKVRRDYESSRLLEFFYKNQTNFYRFLSKIFVYLIDFFRFFSR